MEVPVYSLRSDVNSEDANSFKEKLLRQIHAHFIDQHLIDVTFKLSNPIALVTAHSLILSAASPYFMEVFNSEKRYRAEIEITEIDSVTFETLIAYCYTGEIVLTIENMERMLKGCVMLQLDDAVTKCADFIIENIPHYPLQRLYALESELQYAALYRRVFEYDIKHFVSIAQSAEFLNFDFSKLQKLLENDDLNRDYEEDVFEAIKLWYQHDVTNREQHLPDLIACLRLTQFDKDFIISNIYALPGCQSLALEAVSWHDNPSDRSNVKLKYTKMREGREQILLALNIRASPIYSSLPKAECRTIFKYNTDIHWWDEWCEIIINIDDFEAIFMDDSLYFIGGRQNFGKTVNNVSRWNLKTKTFKQLPGMNQARVAHSVAILNDKIYAIGGRKGSYSDKNVFQSVEMYSVSYGWKLIKSMTTPRCGAGAVGYNGKLYVMGGVNDCALKSVECYDPLTNSWTQCADMIGENECCSATVEEGCIYVACGSDKNFTATVERYNPQYNEWTKIWTCSALYAPEKTCCVNFQNRVWAYYAINDEDFNGDTENRIFAYMEEDDEWLDMKKLPDVTSLHYCFTVPKTLFRDK